MAKKPPRAKTVTSDVPAAVPPRPKPYVFISHDTRDADIAEAFANLLQDASGGVLRSFRSSDRKGTSGIEFGTEWYSAIMDRLKDATDVVALLTPQSLGRPWILYEAGVAKGRLDTVVFGVALGVPLEKVGVGPFAQFQNCGDDEDSLTKLVLQLIRRNPDADPREEAVRRQVVAFRVNSAAILSKRPTGVATPSVAELDIGAIARLFEEVKIMFRQLPDRLESVVEQRLSRPSPLPQVRVTPDILSELYSRLIKDNSRRGWQEARMIAQEFFPSLVGPVIAMQRAVTHGDSRAIEAAAQNIREAVNTAGHPASDDRLLHELPRDERMWIRDFPLMIGEAASRRSVQPGVSLATEAAPRDVAPPARKRPPA